MFGLSGAMLWVVLGLGATCISGGAFLYHKIQENAVLENTVQEYDAAYTELSNRILIMNQALENREQAKREGAEKADIAKQEIQEIRGQNATVENWSNTDIPPDIVARVRDYTEPAKDSEQTTARRLIDRLQETFRREPEKEH